MNTDNGAEDFRGKLKRLGEKLSEQQRRFRGAHALDQEIRRELDQMASDYEDLERRLDAAGDSGSDKLGAEFAQEFASLRGLLDRWLKRTDAKYTDSD